MRPITITVGPLTSASANAIALSQTPTAGALTLNGAAVTGGVATFSVPRRVLITTTGNETTRTFTVTGTGWNGTAISEVIQGVSGATAQSVLDYMTVTSIVISGNAANALTVGTSTVASSTWLRLDEWAPAQTTIQCTVTGTVNYTVEQTMQDPNSPTNPIAPASVVWLSSLDPNVVGATTSQLSYYPNAPLWARVTLNSGSGSVSSVFSQNGAVPY